MNTEQFLLGDKIKEIEATFSKNGWIVVYESTPIGAESFLLYPCLAAGNKVAEYKTHNNWVVEPGYEGRPSIITNYSNGKGRTTYHGFGEKGFEPFIYDRDFRFDGGDDHYIDLSEEFVFYFKLYEQCEDKRTRTYSFIEETGDLDPVVQVSPFRVQVKLRYLIEYISVRRLHFFLCFDFVRTAPGSLHDMGLSEMDKTVEGKHFFYRFQLRDLSKVIGSDKCDSWIRGKTYLVPKKKQDVTYHFELDDSKYESFITGYDAEGNEILEKCDKDKTSAFKLTYFKKEVLDKYYNDPGRYQVDPFYVKSNFWTLKIDNMVEGYVPVFLDELRMLPHKEQLHWKQYNIGPQKGMSHTYYQTMIEGNWAEYPETVDLFFKHRYEEFNEAWEKKNGWRLYKPLAKEDEHYFNSLHLPTSDNVKSFCEQILALVKLTIDRLNEAELAKGLAVEANEKGLAKFQKFLGSKGLDLPVMHEFLRNLQALRSGLIAHSFSKSNKDCKAAMTYFKMDGKNYREVAKQIFLRSVFALNTLEKCLVPDSEYAKKLAARNDPEVTE